jgi:hypothetical protein
VASTFFQLVTAFATAIAAQNGQTLVQQPGNTGWKCQGVPSVPDIAIGYRRQALSANDKPPRITCVALGGDIVPVTQPGGPNRNWRTRMFTIQVYVWGADDAQAEDLYINSLLAWQHMFAVDAPNKQPGRPATFSAERWENEVDGAAGQSIRGWMISYSVMWEITVQDKPNTLTIVREVDAALSLNNPTEVQNVVVR